MAGLFEHITMFPLDNIKVMKLNNDCPLKIIFINYRHIVLHPKI